MRRLLPLLAAVVLLGSGCAGPNLVRVQPWERDALHTAMMEHTFFSREAAAGGRGVGGNGCGCN